MVYLPPPIGEKLNAKSIMTVSLNIIMLRHPQVSRFTQTIKFSPRVEATGSVLWRSQDVGNFP